MYLFGGMRSILSWETIVHYPRYLLRGQIHLKDTTLFRWARINSDCLFVLQVCFLDILVSGSSIRTSPTTLTSTFTPFLY